MWFAARDLVFGKGAFPVPEAPASIAREVEGREMTQLPEGVEQLVKFLMNVLMIEIRAESFFALCCQIFRDPDVFAERRAEAELAATLVERISADEQIHVGYLQVLISELRSFTWRTVAGGTERSRRYPRSQCGPGWSSGMAERPSATSPRRAHFRGNLEPRVLAALGEADGSAFLRRFDGLEERLAA